MSPEQATGDRDVDPRTDVYALGSVLYEMLTGDPPYQGSSAQAVLGQIITGDPVSATKKRPSIPPNVDAAIRKALEKLPADRFTSAQDLSKALSDSMFRHREPQRVGWASASPRWRTLAILASSAAGGLAIWLTGVFLLGRSDPPSFGGLVSMGFPAHLQVTLPLEVSLPLDTGLPVLAISPNGPLLVFVGERNGIRQLYTRTWTDSEAQPIPGTEGAGGPFFSPDGEWVAFFDGLMLERVPIGGGAPVPFHEATPIGVTRGAAWIGDSAVVMAPSSNEGLFLGSALGDTVRTFLDWELELTPLDVPAASPSPIADESKAVFTQSVGASQRDAQVAVVSVPSGDVQVVLNGGNSPRYSLSAPQP